MRKWKDRLLQELTRQNLFLSDQHKERFSQQWDSLKDQPFTTPGLCKNLFMAAWDEEHYQFYAATIAELCAQNAKDPSYMLEKGKAILDNVALSERELFKLSIFFLEHEGETPEVLKLGSLSRHWNEIAERTLEAARVIDKLAAQAYTK